MQRLHADPCGVHSFASTIEGHSTLPFALAFAPSPSHSHLLAVADEDGFLTLLNTRLPSQPSTSSPCPSRTSIPAHSNAVLDVAFSSTSHHLASASADQTVRLFDTHTHTLTSSYTHHTGSVKTLAPSADPHVWASGSRDGTARVWDVRGGDKGMVLQGVGGEMVGKKRVRGRGMGTALTPSSHSVTSLAFVGPHLLLSSSSSCPTLLLHDLRYCPPVPLLSLHPPAPTRTSPTPHRLYGVSCIDYHEGRHAVVAAYTNHTLVVWGMRGEGYSEGVGCADGSAGVVQEVWKGGHKVNFYTKVRWEEGGEHVACGSTDGGVWVYGRGKAKAVKVLRGHEEEVGCVAWSRSERMLLASGSDDHLVRLWKASGAERREEEEEDEGEEEEKEAREEGDVEQEEMEVEDGSDKENDPPADGGSLLTAAAGSSSYPSLPSTPLRDVTNQEEEERVVRKKVRLTKRGRAVAGPRSAPSRTGAAAPSSTRPVSRRVRTLLDLWALPAEGKEERTWQSTGAGRDMDTADA